MESKELIIKFSYVILNYGGKLIEENIFELPAYWRRDVIFKVKFPKHDIGRVIIENKPTLLDVTLDNEFELIRLLEQLNVIKKNESN